MSEPRVPPQPSDVPPRSVAADSTAARTSLPPGARPLSESRGVVRPLLRLALPSLAEQFLLMLVVYSDTLLTGRYLSPQHLAAISLMAYVSWMLVNLFAVVGIAATAMTARFVGAGDYAGACRVVEQSYLLGGLIALVTTAIGFTFRSQWVALMQLEGTSAELAAGYLAYLLPVLPALMLQAVGIACLRGAGDMVTGLVSMAIVNLVNLSVSWVLVLGLGPFPRWGWDGIAAGTALGHVVGAAIITGSLVRGRAGLRLHWRGMWPDRELIRRLLRIGLPGGTDVLTVTGFQMWFVAVINQLGDLAAAAHGVAIRIESLGYLPATAFQMAAATLAGQFLGAKDHRRARRAVATTLAVALAAMGLAGGIFFFGAEGLSRIFLGRQKPELLQLTSSLLRIVAFAMPALAVISVLTGALRGAGDTRWPLVFTLVGYLGVRMPLTYLLAHGLGLGVPGAWYAMWADLALRALLVWGRFRQGGWQRVTL